MCWYSRPRGSRHATWPNRDKRRWRKMSPMVDKPDRWSTSALETWTHQHTSIADTSCGKPPVYSCRPARGSMFLYLRAEQTLSVIGIGVLWCWYWDYCNSIPSVENSSLNRQVQSCVEHPVGSSSIRTLLTATVDELLYSFNWYTIYEDCWRRCHRHPRFGVLSLATIV